ncbi:hypothetical protein CJZ26_24655, partial [Salmonella enterica subsp. enterica serovar Kentucky]
INCAPVHRFQPGMGRLLRLPARIKAGSYRQSVRCMVMHGAESHGMRFWAVFGEKTGVFMAQGVKPP